MVLSNIELSAWSLEFITIVNNAIIHTVKLCTKKICFSFTQNFLQNIFCRLSLFCPVFVIRPHY